MNNTQKSVSKNQQFDQNGMFQRSKMSQVASKTQVGTSNNNIMKQTISDLFPSNKNQTKPNEKVLVQNNITQNKNVQFNTNNMLIESLKASGLLANLSNMMPNLINPNVNNPSVLIGPISFNTEDLRTIRPNAYQLLYKEYPSYCSQCGWRSSESPKLKEKPLMRAHLDWHFRQNRRIKEGVRRRKPRGWYVDEKTWPLSYEENVNGLGNETNSPFESVGEFKNTQFGVKDELGLGGNEGNYGSSDGSNLSRMGNNSFSENLSRSELMKLTVPVHEGHSEGICLICKEQVDSFWSEVDEEWLYTNAVMDDEVLYHATCFADSKKEIAKENHSKNNLIPTSVISK
ncbi:hypothetical protein BB559_002887 [Furculomyces boomerangus]|uniref:Pcf11 C-terminal domain-containing protein n=1 Tax=Furculomyces boomerangus TaxID=61424 RepID=A0A2T9YRI1_9FUNG|nr:hypothetical protein BB559_002887 [Furculomyces boomerangus]